MLGSKLVSAVRTVWLAHRAAGLQENGSSQGLYPKLCARSTTEQVTGTIDSIISMRKLRALPSNARKTWLRSLLIWNESGKFQWCVLRAHSGDSYCKELSWLIFRYYIYSHCWLWGGSKMNTLRSCLIRINEYMSNVIQLLCSDYFLV